MTRIKGASLLIAILACSYLIFFFDCVFLAYLAGIAFGMAGSRLSAWHSMRSRLREIRENKSPIPWIMQ